MRSLLCTCALVIAVTSLPSAEVGATGMNLNYVALPRPMSVEECKTHGRAAMLQAGLELLSDTTEAAWAQTNPDVLAAVYCLNDYGVAIVAVSGPSIDLTVPVIDTLMPILTGGSGFTLAPGPRPILGK